MDFNVAEFASLGAKIAELGLKLAELRAQRDELVKLVAELEKELMPLVVQHGKFIAALTGHAFPTPTAPAPMMMQPAPGFTEGQGMASPGGNNTAMKQRVIAFLSRGVDETITPFEIADALKIDVNVVREAMRDIREGRMRQVAAPPLPDGNGAAGNGVS